MAKLRHLQHLLERIAQVDAARARTLVVKARAVGHFTTGGRGVNAPDMLPRDATNTLLLALQMDAPTEAGEAVTALRELPLTLLEHNPGDDDSGFRQVHNLSNLEDQARSDFLRECLAWGKPETLGETLDLLFGNRGAFVNRFDRIIHKATPRRSEVTLELAEAGPQPGMWFPPRWRFQFFGEGDLDSGDELGLWASKTVFVEALIALRDLIHDPAPEEADEVLADG